MSRSPFLARSRTSSSVSSGLNSSPASRPSPGSCLICVPCVLSGNPLNACEDRTVRKSSCLCVDTSVLGTPVVFRLFDVLFFRSPPLIALLRRASVAAKGELPLWKGFSSLKALLLIGGRVAESSGSSTFIVGVVSLLRFPREEGRCTSALRSDSVSEERACLLERFLLLEVLPPLATESTSSTGVRELCRGFLFVACGKGGGRMEPVSCASSASSPFTVPSWLLGISVMPLLVLLTRSRAASILRERGTSSRVKMSMSWGFLAEAGKEMLCSTKIERSLGTVSDAGSNDGDRYSMSTRSMSEAIVPSDSRKVMGQLGQSENEFQKPGRSRVR